jgi:hypothetical protein
LFNEARTPLDLLTCTFRAYLAMRGLGNMARKPGRRPMQPVAARDAAYRARKLFSRFGDVAGNLMRQLLDETSALWAGIIRDTLERVDRAFEATDAGVRAARGRSFAHTRNDLAVAMRMGEFAVSVQSMVAGRAFSIPAALERVLDKVRDTFSTARVGVKQITKQNPRRTVAGLGMCTMCMTDKVNSLTSV